MKLARVGAVIAVAAIVVSACSGSSTPAPAASAGASAAASAAATKGTLKIGVTLPLSGGSAADGQPTMKGAQLAIDEINAKGGVGGYTLQMYPLDHAVNGKYNEQQGAQDMQTFVADPTVVGVMGPYNSAVAKVQIPISNDAGLLQCSPANTNQSLTKPEFGALDYRKNFPDRINYVRVATTDDIQGPAMAVYAFKTLSLKNLLIVDDVTTFGKGVADTFQAKWEALGGKVVDRVGAGVDTTDFNSIITAAKPKSPDGVYYGGVVTSGAGLLLKQLRQQGLTIPFMGPDGIVNGSGKNEGALIKIAGAQASANSFGTIAAIGDFPAKKDFDAAFIEHFKNDSTFKTPGAYSGPGYACTTVIIKSLEAFLQANPNADQKAIREGVRAYAADPTHSFDTVLGKTSFDKNGDNTQKFISFYTTDPAAADGLGDWVFKEQQDFSAQ